MSNMQIYVKSDTKVDVLMSTYNGSLYLSEQLNSIFSQASHSLHISINVRDDGSNDKTTELISEHFCTRLNFYSESNVGVVSSFLKLLAYPCHNVEFVAFSDQDDYWRKNKLEKAVNALKLLSNIPALYFSRLDIVDVNLEHQFYSKIPNKPFCLQNALAENIATGCTIVINNAALKLLRENMPDPKKLVMHDWWFYLVISTLGTVVYDPEPTILYRQHGNNVEGMKSGLAKLKAKFRNITRPPKYVKVSTQVAEFKRCYYQMLSNEQKKLVDDFLLATSGFNIWKKLKLVLSGRVYRQTNTETLSFLISMLLNRI